MANNTSVAGILMVVAWLMLVNIGIVLPRHYKQAWQETRKMCGQAVWFQVCTGSQAIFIY